VAAVAQTIARSRIGGAPDGSCGGEQNPVALVDLSTASRPPVHRPVIAGTIANIRLRVTIFCRRCTWQQVRGRIHSAGLVFLPDRRPAQPLRRIVGSSGPRTDACTDHGRHDDPRGRPLGAARPLTGGRLPTCAHCVRVHDGPVYAFTTVSRSRPSSDPNARARQRRHPTSLVTMRAVGVAAASTIWEALDGRASRVAMRST